MTSEERKKQLLKVKEESSPYMTGIPLLYHGERKQFDVYQIPLSVLTYNPYNGRIGSEVKSYERQHHQLNPDDPVDVAIIEGFLWDSKEQANKKTMASLLNDHQQKFGIVTADGKIIDGNRRACLLNKLWRDDSIEVSIKKHCEWFYAIILPGDADKREILRLETTYQMGEDAKVDYNPIEKYLKCGDLRNESFTVDEIASFMGVAKTEVQTYLKTLELMNDYLETYGYDGMYTQLDGNEDSFLKLDAALRKYKAGSVSSMWDYSPETDVNDLKVCAFDYIRLGFEQTDFRDIIRTPSKSNSSFFANKEIWESFRDRHFGVVESVEEEPVQKMIQKHPDADLKRLLRVRDNNWRKGIEAKLRENYGIHKDKLGNKQEAAEPLRLLAKALDALKSVDTGASSFLAEAADISLKLQEIQGVVVKMENSLNCK